MPYGEAKIYHDGSHFIAIPYVPNPRSRRPKPPEEQITVVDENADNETIDGLSETDETTNDTSKKSEAAVVESVENSGDTENKTERKLTRKELFEELYNETRDKKRSERKKIITEKMLPYFRDKQATAEFVNAQFERKLRNIICRRVRLMRKVNLQTFNYFCTFTYNSAKHTEESFMRKLKGCFKMMCHRRNWKYVGVWERSPEKKRLHFHGLFYIPDGAMVGDLIEVHDYSPIKKKVQHTIQNTYFNERFGRSDFKPVEDRRMLGEAVAYLTKYMEKTGEKIVYSKGLPQYFISDILDEDVVCTIGQEDRKLLHYDNFNCWDEGCLVGSVSKEVIAQMRKSN